MAGPMVVGLVLQALEKAANAYSANVEAKEAASGMRRQSRGIMIDAQNQTRQMRVAGDSFRAQQSVDFLKSGVSLAGSPLLVLDETERLVKEEIDSVNQRAQGQAAQLRKGRKNAKRAGRMALLTGGLATGAKGAEAYKASKEPS